MKFQLPISIPPLSQPIRYTDRILLIGSCFTEHISGRLARLKFRTLGNPHGILFNPLSVAGSLKSYAQDHQYEHQDLFQLNELWNSWDHHTRFSHIDKNAALDGINASQSEAASFLREADWIIITLGSAFQYFLTENSNTSAGRSAGYPVANNHRAPGTWFRKELLDITSIQDALKDALGVISQLNPSAQILFTISPVRHARDGVVENNRSKARLIEAVHALCGELGHCHYFPAYEIVIDVLRDYRYYDIDLVHPNFAATEAVWEAFVSACIDAEAAPLMQQVKEIMTARSHLPRFPQTEGHRAFLRTYADKVALLAAAHPYLNLADEARYFHAD